MSALENDDKIKSTADLQFLKLKTAKLSSVDLSKKGSIDEPIRLLIRKLNNLQDYFSLSSCSGRVMIASKERNNEKQNISWHANLHHCPSYDELKNNFKGQNTILKYEPFVLHVQCKDFMSAKPLLSHALQSGFRNSGLIPAKQGRYVLGVRSTLTLELPVTDENGEILVSETYIEVLQKTIESKFAQNDIYIKRFEESIDKMVENKKENRETLIDLENLKTSSSG